MLKLTTYRNLQIFLVIIAVIGMSFALFFLQRYMGFSPCPLCIFQRVGLIVMGIFAFLAFLFNPKRPLVRVLLMLGALLGMLWSVGVAARHVWIQHLPPDQVPSCGPGLDYWMDTLPIAQVFKEVFKGSGECAVIDWTFLGFSIPEMSLAFFGVLLLLIVWAMRQAKFP